MQFIQFGMLGALGALAIPVVIHLMFRQRARSVDLGTLQFLKIVLRDHARKRRLKRWVLLALRLACVALIALLFARPYLLATETVEGERLVVVLLDRSASMGLIGGPRPIDLALAEAGKVISQAGRGTRLEMATFGTEVSPVSRPSSLQGVEPSEAGTDYSAAMAWARDLCVRSGETHKELHVLTDLQRSGLDRGDSVSLPAGLDVHLADFGRAFPRNVAVTALAIEPKTPRPGETVKVTATVFNASPIALAKVPVKLHLESPGTPARDVRKAVDLDGSASATVVYTLAEMPRGLWRGNVEAEAKDDLPFDDRRYLALSVAAPASVLLVDGDPGRSPFESETYFLGAALRLAPAGERYAKSPFDVKTVRLTSGSPLPDLSQTSAVVLANVDGLSPSDASRLSAFVDRGGGLVVFTGDRVKPEGVRSLLEAGLGVGDVIGPVEATDLPWRLDRWEASHPVFRPFRDPEHGDLRRPSFSAITRIKPDPKALVIATFRGGDPAMLERPHGRGKVIWFASACDLAWGDWPRGRMYLPLVHQLLAYATGLAEGGPVRQETASLDRKAGVTEADGVARVTNVDPAESDTARCTPKEFADRFGFRLPEPSAPTSRPEVGSTHDDRLRGDEVWPWFALALVGLTLLENFLANRTAA